MSLKPSFIGMTKYPLEAYRRQLPHWRKSDALYAVNWQIHKDQNDLSSPERSTVLSSLRYFEDERYDLHAFAVMNDHVHVIVKPLYEHRLETIVQSWKSFSANRLQRLSSRLGRVWQEEYFDRIIRNPAHYDKLVNYVLENPVKRWPDLTAYQWAGLGNAGERGIRIG